MMLGKGRRGVVSVLSQSTHAQMTRNLLPLSLAVTSVGCDDAATSQVPLRNVAPTETVEETKGGSSSSAEANHQSQEHGQQAVETKGPQIGGVFGRLTYQADSTRQWRYRRYYIRKSQSGELADAIVCLSSRSLRKYDSDEDEPKTWTMDQNNFEFRPEVLAIRAGDEVRFLNSDKAAHNVNASGAYDSFNVMTPVVTSLERTFAKADDEIALKQSHREADEQYPREIEI